MPLPEKTAHASNIFLLLDLQPSLEVRLEAARDLYAELRVAQAYFAGALFN